MFPAWSATYPFPRATSPQNHLLAAPATSFLHPRDHLRSDDTRDIYPPPRISPSGLSPASGRRQDRLARLDHSSAWPNPHIYLLTPAISLTLTSLLFRLAIVER